MPTWIMVVLFAMVRALYSAAVEAFVTWGILNCFLPKAYELSYWVYYLLWYVIGFIVSCIRLNRMFKD